MQYQLIKKPNSKYSALEQVLTNRGIKFENIEHYLNTTDEDILSPLLLNNMENGAKMLVKHIQNNDMVYMIIDPDADGFTSSALLLNYLNLLFPSFVQNNIYHVYHSGKQHGIEEHFIPDILSKNCKLVICADSSSNDYTQHKILSDNEIDVLVIDHHEAEKVSENACVINNQLCDYPTKSLSGVGVVYKFCSYLDNLLGLDNSNLFLDLVAIGMVADVMSLKDFETKHLIFKGIKNVRNPFISELKKAQSYSIDRSGGLNPYTIGFYVGPAINAVIRMGNQEDKQLLFESMLDYKGYEMIPSTKRGCKGQFETRVSQACRNCNNIKNKQNKFRDEGIELIKKKIEDMNLDENKILLIPLEKGEINPNLTGLIANKIMSDYKKPTLLMLKKPDLETGEILLEGSGRGYESKDFNDFKQFLKDSNYFYLAEGHANAFGSGMKYDNLEEFINYSNDSLKNCDFTSCYKVDFVWDYYDFNPKDILELAKINNICGQGLEMPYIVLKNILITDKNLTLMSPDKSPTLKIKFPNETSLIKFKSSQEEYETLLPENGGAIKIDIIGTCNINEWNGKVYPQIQIIDYEITEKLEYCF